MVINTNTGPPIVITSTSADELINLGRCRLHFKLSPKTFAYYFQIIKNLKRDLILDLGLNFQKTFKISQDITDDDDLYLHIRRKIVTFSQQAKNTTNHISTCECSTLHICIIHNSTEVQAMGGQHHQQTTRSRHDTTNYEYLDITCDNCTQEGIETTPSNKC